mmetsp:Transcript_59554/g.128865  ORF Transcript_59554/g.128865 Transcript_59554/m.128865 type:complete len:273 (-) Transcript_59554:2507-3325(-)
MTRFTQAAMRLATSSSTARSGRLACFLPAPERFRFPARRAAWRPRKAPRRTFCFCAGESVTDAAIESSSTSAQSSAKLPVKATTPGVSGGRTGSSCVATNVSCERCTKTFLLFRICSAQGSPRSSRGPRTAKAPKTASHHLSQFFLLPQSLREVRRSSLASSQPESACALSCRASSLPSLLARCAAQNQKMAAALVSRGRAPVPATCVPRPLASNDRACVAHSSGDCCFATAHREDLRETCFKALESTSARRRARSPSRRRSTAVAFPTFFD